MKNRELGDRSFVAPNGTLDRRRRVAGAGLALRELRPALNLDDLTGSTNGYSDAMPQV